MDPYLASMSPDINSAYKRISRQLVLLPDETMSVRLFSEMQAKKPRKVFLTPFLASEIPEILESFPDILIGYIGSAALKADSRLYTAEFSDIDAIAQGANLLASFCKKLSPETVAVAVLLPEEALNELSGAFLKAFRQAGGTGTPFIIGAKKDFSADSVSRLKNIDIRAALIAISGSAGSRYKRQLFSKANYVVELQPIFINKDALSDVVLSWDFERALGAIKTRMELKKPGKEYLPWKESK